MCTDNGVVNATENYCKQFLSYFLHLMHCYLIHACSDWLKSEICLEDSKRLNTSIPNINLDYTDFLHNPLFLDIIPFQ